MRFFVLFGIGVLVACSGGSADPVVSPASSSSSSSSGCPAVTAEACKPAFHVATASEVLGAAKAFDYQRLSSGKAQKLTVGDDLVADADIEVLASDLTPAGSDCADCHAPLFRTQGFASQVVPGITCTRSDEQPVTRAFGCSKITIAKGTTFRIRPMIEDMHPSSPTYWAWVDLVEPCATSCGAGEVLCAETHTCFTPEQACLFCEGREPAYCACRDDNCAQKPEGSTCSYSSSPDVLQSGVCGGTGCRPQR